MTADELQSRLLMMPTAWRATFSHGANWSYDRPQRYEPGERMTPLYDGPTILAALRAQQGKTLEEVIDALSKSMTDLDEFVTQEFRR